jgi:hypothetical protein
MEPLALPLFVQHGGHAPSRNAHSAVAYMFRRIPDTTKIERLIGWKPTKALNAILADVVGERRALSAA